jgi:hypothetical protein
MTSVIYHKVSNSPISETKSRWRKEAHVTPSVVDLLLTTYYKTYRHFHLRNLRTILCRFKHTIEHDLIRE